MATDTWTGAFGGNWSDPTGWSGGTVPAAGDTVQLSDALSGPYTVHLDANEGAYAALTVSAANATLALYYGGLTLSVSGATTLSAGDIAIAGNATLDTGTFVESGGFLGMSNGTLDASGQATLSGGGLGIYGGTLHAGSLAFAGGSFGISGGDVTVTNQVSETAGTAGFYGGTFNAGSLAVSGGSLGMSGGTLDASGALTLSGTGSIGLYNTAATLEAGSLSQTGGSLGMSGGTLAVAGEASFIGGTDVFYGGSTVDAGSLQVGSSSAAHTLTVNGAVFAVSGTASVAAGSTLSMYGGSFSTKGGITNSGTISGAGTLGGPHQRHRHYLRRRRYSRPHRHRRQRADLRDRFIWRSEDRWHRHLAASLGLSRHQPSARDRSLGQPDHQRRRGRHRGHVQAGWRYPHRRARFLQVTARRPYRASARSTAPRWAGRQRCRHPATGGTLTLNGDIYSGIVPEVAAGATFSLLGAVQLDASEPPPFGSYPVHFDFLSSASGTLQLGTATARQSFETNGTIANMNVSTNGTPTDVLDLADTQPSSITSAMIASGNTIELFNGATMIDHFALASSVGTAAVHWVSDGGAGSNIFLST